MKEYIGKNSTKELGKQIYNTFNEKLLTKIDKENFDTYKSNSDEKVSKFFDNIDNFYDYINNAAYIPKYGVSGVGGAATTLTRLWDSVGLKAAAGTDTEAPINDFDNLAPFNRKKCVGTWSEPNEKGISHFTVNAYYDDPDYIEDGSMGDYVAVEIEPFWYYQDLEEGILGISPGPQIVPGWHVHPICIDEDGNVRKKTYLPCYELAANEDGHAVSLPDYHPAWGSYKGLIDIARTYGEGNKSAHLEPMAARHYEWLMFTIEYATTNAQSIIQGVSTLPYSSVHVAAASGENINYIITTADVGSRFVIGQTIYIGTPYSTTPPNISGYNIITAIESCDIEGNIDENNEYYKITFTGDSRTIVAGTTTISSRPWKTGSCNNVLTPSGSLKNNNSGKYPMRYRWRENIWGNTYSVCNDLFTQRKGSGIDNDPYYIVWYYLIDQNYYPITNTSPTNIDFETNAFVQLEQNTNYTNGYIKEIKNDLKYPQCIIPITLGGTSNSYYADYMTIEGEAQNRTVKFGGATTYTNFHGPLHFRSDYVPSTGGWYLGGGLYFRQ